MMTDQQLAERIRRTGDLINGSARMRAELETARQCTEVALGVVALIADAVPDMSDRATVISDLVAQWRALSPSAQASYRSEPGPVSPLVMFAYDKIDEIDAAPFTGLANQPSQPEPEADRMHQQHWNEHLTRLRNRATVATGSGALVIDP